jgi:CheY-like chemotaxis protein
MERLDSVGVLAGGIAHDFNNYLTSIIGNITLAREVPELIVESLENAEEACRNAQQLTRQLLTFAKGGDPIKETGDLVLAVQKAAKFSLSGSKMKLHFASKISEAITPFDSGQISQVINNLCVNASQATNEKGKITIRISAHRVRRKRDLLAPGPYARIVVQDNGPGIPADILPRIWDAYFTTKASGSGLGLATCHSIIRRHQGSISVTSSPGKGTRFTILIPLLAPGSHLPICQVHQDTNLRPCRILVMDDQAPIRMVSKRMMEKLGHEVVAVENGPDAVAVFRDAMRIGQPFHLAVLDMTIPGSISGQETLQLLREIDPSVYAVICSGYSEQAPYVSPEGGGFDFFLPKPFTFTQIRNLLNECSGRSSLAA